MRHLTRASLVVGLFAWLAGACGARTGDESLDEGFGGSGFGGTGFGGTGTGAAGHPAGGTAGFGAGGFGGVAAGGFGGGFGGVAAGGAGGIPTGGVSGFGAAGGGFGGVAAGGFGGGGFGGSFGGGGFGGIGAFGGSGGGPSGPCCFPHPSPGCFDPKITACVCATDQFCCQQQWDSLCANEVTSLGCGNCGGTGGAGGTGGIAGFGGVGAFGGGGSGGSGGLTCGGNPCSDVSAPGGFTLSACCPPTSPFQCGLDTTPLPSFVPLPNGCLPKNQPGVPDPSCPDDSIAGFTLAGCCKPNGMCGNDYSLIQLGCVDTSGSGGPPPTKCGVGGAGGSGGGGPFTGSCCQAHPWEGCGDPGVFSCVCPKDPFCCNGTWDSICVNEVTSLGCGNCGGTGGGGAGGAPACDPALCPTPGPIPACCVTVNGPCGVVTPQGCIPIGLPPPPNP